MSAAVIAATSAANSAQASINAARQRAKCEKVLSSFDSDAATVQQKREYASCVNQMYPSDGAGLVVAICFLVAMVVGIIAAIFCTVKEGWGSSIERGFFGLMVGFLTTMAVCTLGVGLFVASAYVIGRF